MVDPGLVSLVELGVLAVGVTIALFEIRNMGQTRKTEIALQFFDKMTNPEFWELYTHTVHEQQFESMEEWGKKYGPYTNPDAYNKFVAFLQYYNAAGDILKKGIVDLDDIHVYCSPIAILMFYEKFQPMMDSMRKWYSMEDTPNPAEYLYNETRKKYPKITTTAPYER